MRKVLVQYSFHTNLMPPAAIPINPEVVDLPTPQFAGKAGFSMQLILGAVADAATPAPEKEWDFANALGLRPGSQAALLAGMYHLARRAHHRYHLPPAFLH